jgi:hypothetical protein
MKNIIPLFVILLILGGNIATAVARQRVKPSPRVENFVDIVNHLSSTNYRCKRVVYEDNRDKFKGDRVMTRSKYFLTLAQKIDSLDIINFQCDTICIYSSGPDWIVGLTDPETIKCRKGFFFYKKGILEPTTVAEHPYYNEITRIEGKEPDPLPSTLQWFMKISSCFDDQKMSRLFVECSGVTSRLIRIVIRNHRVVYCDKYEE